MKDTFNLKQECIFISLASYAHDIITQGDIYAFNGEAYFMAKAIDTHFKKKIKRYSKSRMNKLTDYLRDVMGPAFPDKLNASIIMASSLHYLLNENHHECKLVFTPFKQKITSIITALEKSDEHKNELKKANETLIKMLDSKPYNYKTNLDKEKLIETQYKMFYLLKDLLSSITITDKLNKPFTKINNLISTYLDNKELPIVEFEKSQLEDIDKLYYIVALIERIKNVGNIKLDIISKFKTLNLKYLVPNKEVLKTCDKNLDNILLYS